MGISSIPYRSFQVLCFLSETIDCRDHPTSISQLYSLRNAGYKNHHAGNGIQNLSSEADYSLLWVMSWQLLREILVAAWLRMAPFLSVVGEMLFES